MIRRLDHEPAVPPRKVVVARRNAHLEAVVDDRPAPELALRYSNGFVTVEITHDALDAYVEANGGSSLPVYADEQIGDRRTGGAQSRTRVIYDREARLRDVTRSRESHYVRLVGAVLP